MEYTAKQGLINQLNIIMRDYRRSMEMEETNSAEKYKMRVAVKIAVKTDAQAERAWRQWPYYPSSQPSAFEALLNETAY